MTEQMHVVAAGPDGGLWVVKVGGPEVGYFSLWQKDIAGSETRLSALPSGKINEYGIRQWLSDHGTDPDATESLVSGLMHLYPDRFSD